MSCPQRTAAEAVQSQLSPPGIVRSLSAEDALAPFTAPSVRFTERFSDRVFRHPKSGEGVIHNGTRYRNLEMGWMPKTGQPYVFGSPKQPAIGRLVFLHGLGLDISNIGSVIPVIRTLMRVTNGVDLGKGPRATWLLKNHPELQVPLELAAFDLPSAGWARPMTPNFSMADMVQSIQGPLREIQAERFLPTIIVCRSASCAPSLLVDVPGLVGVVATGGTYPNKEVLDYNFDAIVEMAKERPTVARWSVIDQVIQFFQEPSLVAQLKAAASGGLPVMSLIGSEDPETPQMARDLWSELLQPNGEPYHRSALVIPGGGHQVFRQEKADPERSERIVSAQDADMLALKALLRFSAYHFRWAPAGLPNPTPASLLD